MDTMYNGYRWSLYWFGCMDKVLRKTLCIDIDQVGRIKNEIRVMLLK
jgi:hypothetical protein